MNCYFADIHQILSVEVGLDSDIILIIQEYLPLHTIEDNEIDRMLSLELIEEKINNTVAFAYKAMEIDDDLTFIHDSFQTEEPEKTIECELCGWGLRNCNCNYSMIQDYICEQGLNHLISLDDIYSNPIPDFTGFNERDAYYWRHYGEY